MIWHFFKSQRTISQSQVIGKTRNFTMDTEMPTNRDTAVPDNHESPMHFPRPSSEQTQDVSYILAGIFQQLYTKEIIGKEFLKNLTTSSTGGSQFHQKCMRKLQEAHNEHKRRLDEYMMLEQHIIQARARAASADERALVSAAHNTSPQKYVDLGLPPVKSNFPWFVEEELLKKHHLILPSDFLLKKKTLVEGPKGPKMPHFSLPTVSSVHLFEGVGDDGYDILEELQAHTELPEEERSATTLSTNSPDLRSIPPCSGSIGEAPKSQQVINIEQRDRWRDNMHHEQRVIDRAGLAKLEERHNFLKNPRFLPLTMPRASKLLIKEQPTHFVKKAGRKVAQNKCQNDSFQIFIAKPSVLVFTEWTVGKVYEAILEVKNVSFVSRQLHVLPPTTSFFSVGLGKYPGGYGLVAPGMGAQYNVRFIPDSLADYEDYIMVMSQAQKPLKVGLKAQRRPPILTVPRTLDCGHCLLGGTRVTELCITNQGGGGQFCILKKSSWPAANFKTAVSPDSLEVGVFRIRPAVFQLLPDQKIEVELIFSPSSPDKFEEELVMVCDNCQVQCLTIKGEGQSAAVELVSVSDGGEAEPTLGEICDLTADHLIRFPSLNPHSFYMKQVLVHNSINVEMPYTWHILKPNPQTTISPEEQNLSDRLEFYPDESPSFFIEPQMGVLQPNGIHEFVATFAPHSVGSFHNVLHLLLGNIPESRSKNMMQAQKEIKHTAVQELMVPNAKSGGSLLREVIALEIELKGESVPYSVIFHPPTIVIPGSVLVGTTVKRSFKMANYSLAPMRFKWLSETQPNIVEVEPHFGVIDPGDYAELEVGVTGSGPGPLVSNLQCKVENLEDPLNLVVQATINGPQVVLNEASVDFGLVYLGETVTRLLTLRNTTQLRAFWRLQFYTTADSERSELRIIPESGEIGPLGEFEVTIRYTPSKTCRLSTILDLEVTDGNRTSAAVTADVQTPQACFLECELIISNAFLSVPQVKSVTLLNQTSFCTNYQFTSLKGKMAKNCQVTVYPRSGTLAPREKLQLQITFVCHAVGEVNDLLLPCYIDGMEKPIILSLYANVMPLSINFATPDSHGEDLRVVFADPVILGSVVTRQVVLENLTAIRAPWAVSLEHFAAKPPAPPPNNFDFKSANTRRAMLGRTPNLLDPLARTSKPAQGQSNPMLTGGLGAAFVMKPSYGILEPYQTQVIEIEAYSDMWGSYRDNLICDIEGLPPKRIPVEMNVKGCPLIFQVVAGQENKKAYVHFGTSINNGPQVERKMRINNTSSHDIRVDWRIFNASESKDTKLVDLNMWCGPAFPKHDQSAIEAASSLLKESSVMETGVASALDSTSSAVLDNLETACDKLPSRTYPKIVSVQIKPHWGQLCDQPFRMVPEQITIPAHGHSIVSVFFTPILVLDENENAPDSKDWTSFALGYMSLDSGKNSIPKLMRADGYSVQPLRLDLRGTATKGTLLIEPDTEDDDDEMEKKIKFRLPLGKTLSLECKRTMDTVQYRYCTILNNTEMPMDFKLTVSHPFSLHPSQPSNRNLKNSERALYEETSAKTSLRSQENMRVKVGFKLSNSTFDVLRSLRSKESIPGAQLLKNSNTGTEFLVFSDNLEVCFPNGTSQHLPIQAMVSVPTLRVSPTKLDFGACFVGQERCLQIKIENIGESDSLWNAQLESQQDSMNEHCFRIEPAQSFLEGSVTLLAKNRMLLSVYFTPSCNEKCEAMLVFGGMLGEPPHHVQISGVGSYDGKQEV